MGHPFFSTDVPPRVFAHRGYVSSAAAAAGTLENTRAAVEGALAAGAHYVESDCHLTRDGVVVLFHDADLSRTLGDPRRVNQVTFRELSELMAGQGGVLSLEAALTEFPELRLNLDVKSAEVSVPAGRIVGALAPERTLVTSFSDRSRRVALAAATQAGGLPATSAGQTKMAQILGALTLRSSRLLDRSFAGVDALQIPERFGVIPVLTARLVREAHARGVEVHVWTINDAETMRKVIALGADGVVTDRADVALATLR